MASNEILDVHLYAREDDGTVCVKCPHCGWIIGLERGPFLGEQYQHSANRKCGGWLQVASTARRVYGNLEDEIRARATPPLEAVGSSGMTADQAQGGSS